MVNATVKYNVVNNGKLHITRGNKKIGQKIYSFSTLPGNKDHMVTAKGELLTNIPGTCGKHCETCHKGCYAFNSARLYSSSVIPAWGENTLLLRAGVAHNMIDEYITRINTSKHTKYKVELFRINVSGEFVDCEDIRKWNELCKKHPEVTFGAYTKNYEALDEFIQKHGYPVKNFIINISQWHHCADEFLAKYPGKFNVFEYDDSNLKNNNLSKEDVDRMARLPHCRAVDEHGNRVKDEKGEYITCSGCTWCYCDRHGSTVLVHAH